MKNFQWTLRNIRPGFYGKHKSHIDEGFITAKSPLGAKRILTKLLKEKYPNENWKPWNSITSPICHFRKTTTETMRIAF